MGYRQGGKGGVLRSANRWPNFLSLWRRIRRKLMTIYGRNIHNAYKPYRKNGPSDRRFFNILSGSCSDAIEFKRRVNRVDGPIFFTNPLHQGQLISFIREHFPDNEALVIGAADKACAHVFDLLGSGDTYLGAKIDWHIDFKSGYRWEPGTYYTDVCHAPYPGGYDIKVPWELSRCQHFVWLGQAYWFTVDEKYAKEFVAEVEDWIENNPWPLGVNWACAMDVAIRVVNWLWGYHLLKESKIIDEQFCLKFHKSLLVHGRHIFHNLENESVAPNNHYLSNLVGLLYLGILCPFFSVAKVWREFGLRELWKEMFRQVYPDGVNFEGSTAYHRLATELNLSAVVLCRINDIHVPDEVMARLEKMIEYVMYYTKPDGTAPIIGDADNGRIHRLTVWADSQREWIDHRYLLGIGGVIFSRKDFASNAGNEFLEAVWMLGDHAVDAMQKLININPAQITDSSKYFPDAGIAIIKREDLYLIACVGNKKNSSRPIHAHNDLGSIELFSEGVSWLIDPGAYTYTADYNARHQFRSIAYHNTVQVDENELFDISDKNPFAVGDGPGVRILNWQCTENNASIAFEYIRKDKLGYLVQRSIGLDKEKRLWTIRDVVKFGDNNRHSVLWWWHFSPSVQVKFLTDRIITVKSDDGKSMTMKFLVSLPLRMSVLQGWTSMSYGNKQNAPLVQLQCDDICVPEVVLTTLIANYLTIQDFCRHLSPS